MPPESVLHLINASGKECTRLIYTIIQFRQIHTLYRWQSELIIYLVHFSAWDGQ